MFDIMRNNIDIMRQIQYKMRKKVVNWREVWRIVKKKR